MEADQRASDTALPGRAGADGDAVKQAVPTSLILGRSGLVNSASDLFEPKGTLTKWIAYL